MNHRTDLAIDRFEAFSSTPEGIKKQDYTHGPFRVTDIEVLTKDAAKRLGKEMGRYLTVEIPLPVDHPENALETEKLLSREISSFIEDGSVLVIGLGNAEVPADALGPYSARRIFATRHIPSDLQNAMGLGGVRRVSSVSVGVLGKTGIESEETASALADITDAKNVIVIDSLAASSIHRLGTAIQITDTGIAPGSGVGGNSKEISRKTLGRRVISIGVPMVVDASVIASESGGNGKSLKGLIVTSKDADKLNAQLSEIISSAVNMALFPEIPAETLKHLVI